MGTRTGRTDSADTTAQAALVALLRAAGHLNTALGDVCAAWGVTHDQYNVLRILRGARPDGLPRYEIADRLISRAPDVTRMLDRLERQGMVERARAEHDRRLSLTRITGRGLALLEQVDPEIAAVHDGFALPLTAAQRATLARLCRALLP